MSEWPTIPTQSKCIAISHELLKRPGIVIFLDTTILIEAYYP